MLTIITRLEFGVGNRVFYQFHLATPGQTAECCPPQPGKAGNHFSPECLTNFAFRNRWASNCSRPDAATKSSQSGQAEPGPSPSGDLKPLGSKVNLPPPSVTL